MGYDKYEEYITVFNERKERSSRDNKGIMKVLKKPSPGNYPVAMIPGQFVDFYRPYSSKELRLFPLNSVTSAPPGKGLTTRNLNLGSEANESDSNSSSSN